MKNSKSTEILFLLVFSTYILILSSCSTNNENNIEGAWKLVAGKYTFPDTIITFYANENFKAVKLFSKTHYSNMTQDTSQQIFVAHAGKYTLEGDEYTEHFEINKNLDGIGNSVTFKYEIVGNQLKILSDDLVEVWEKVE